MSLGQRSSDANKTQSSTGSQHQERRVATETEKREKLLEQQQRKQLQLQAPATDEKVCKPKTQSERQEPTKNKKKIGEKFCFLLRIVFTFTFSGEADNYRIPPHSCASTCIQNQDNGACTKGESKVHFF